MIAINGRTHPALLVATFLLSCLLQTQIFSHAFSTPLLASEYTRKSFNEKVLFGKLLPNLHESSSLKRNKDFRKYLTTKNTQVNLSNRSNDENVQVVSFDPVIKNVSIRLHRINWISWWCQVILTVISSITLLFARSVLNALATGVVSSSPSGSGVRAAVAPGGFLFAGSGIVLSYLSIIWTWGGTRLSRRLRRSNENENSNNNKFFSRIKVATMIRRAIVIGTTLNILGMLITLIGAEQIVGLLAAKVLTMQGVSPFLTGNVAGGGAISAQTVQPLDVLIVQANTNTLLSHFISLVCGLILTRSVHALDPPSVEDDER